MKTVLFVDGQQLNTSFEHVRQLFRELDAYGQVVVCPWDSSAYSPHLLNSFLSEHIGEKDVWQAIVISDLSRESLSDYAFDVWVQDDVADYQDTDLLPAPVRRLGPLVPYLDETGQAVATRLGFDLSGEHVPGRATDEPMPSFSANPYDFVQNLHLTCYPSKIQHPVVKLGHLLLGLPAHILDDGCVGLSASQGDEIRAQVRAELARAMVALAKARAKRREELAMADAYDEIASPDDGAWTPAAAPVAKDGFADDDLDLDGLDISELHLGELDLNGLLGDELTLEELGLDGMSDIDLGDICDEGLGGPVQRKPFDLWMHEQVLARAREAHPDTTIQDYSPAEIALKCPRPVGLAYVTFRDIPDNVPAKSLETENGDLGSLRSEFVVRNHFPDKARFIVVDRKRTGKERRVREEMSFWSAVLLLCVNEVRGLGLKSYALNKMTVGVDFEAYAQELSEKYGYALSARNLLEERLASIEASLNADDRFSRDLPVYEEFVQVDFHVGQYEDLAIPTKRYGWLKDSDKPHDSGIRNLGYGIGRIPHRMRYSHAFDEQYYAEDRARIDASMNETLEEPRHALADASADFRRIEPFDEDVLTGFKANARQVARLEKELTELENKLAGTYSLSILDKGVYEKVMGIVDGRVAKRMGTRAFARQVVLVALAAIIACVIAFVPYIFGFMGGEGLSKPAIAVSVVCLLVVLVAGFIPLKVSHRDVKRMLGEVNDCVRGMLDQLKEKAHSLSVRISDYASYRKGYSLYVRQKEERKPFTKESRELRRMRRDIDELAESLSEDLEALGLWPVVTTEDKFLSWGQAKAAIEDVDFFSLSTSPVHLDRPYNKSRRSGMSIKTPFQFIEWLDIEDVCVFEPGYERGSGNVAS